MVISVEKPKVLISCGGEEVTAPICLNDQTLRKSTDKSGKAGAEVDIRIEKGGRAYQMWRKKVFWSANLGKATKMRLCQTIAMSVLLYGAET